MAEFRAPKVDVALDVTLRLSESEVRALNALAGYGVDNFVKAFYDVLGKAYMEKHEAGLRSFLGCVYQNTGTLLHDVDEARKILKGKVPQ